MNKVFLLLKNFVFNLFLSSVFDFIFRTSRVVEASDESFDIAQVLPGY